MSDDETRLGGLNIWSAAPDEVADLLSNGLGLGLRRCPGPDGNHYVGRADGLAISIHPGKEPAVELAFVVPAIQQAIKECQARGAAVTSSADRRPYGISASLAAPGPLRIELVQTTR